MPVVSHKIQFQNFLLKLTLINSTQSNFVIFKFFSSEIQHPQN